MKTIIITVDDNASAVTILQAVVTALAQSPAAATGDDWRHEGGYPKIKTFAGAALMLQTPIAPDWIPSTMARTLGTQGRFVDDPAVPPGARSPAGYPIAGDRVMFEDEAFANDTELATWRKAVAEQGNQGNLDAERQATLQPGQVDVKSISREQLEGLLVAIARNEVGLSERYGPTKLMHELSAFMPSGIKDDGTGHVVPPASFPELADMTVERAKQLAGLA